MRITVCGRIYRVRFVRGLREQGSFGECDSPNSRYPEIRLDSELSGKALLETAIHEFLHAANWKWDEEVITNEAHELTEFLWRIRKRIPPKHNM